MKYRLPDRTVISTLILVLAAGILTGAVIMTDRRDLTSAAVVISALVLFLSGIFLFTFTKKESLDGRIASLIPIQGMINICRIAADLGITGNAWFLPGRITGETTVMQLMPVSLYKGGSLERGETFVSGPGETGILLPSSGEILMTELKTRFGLIIPDTEEELLSCIREAGEEFLEVADRIEASRSGDSIAITLHNYRLIDGCRRIGEVSPACCTMNPCPVCSLFAMILAEGKDNPVSVDRCRSELRQARVEILYTLSS